MTSPIASAWLLASSASLLGLGCEPSGVGDPCIPEDEYHTDFGGFDEREVNVESRSFQCQTRVCLVDHFRGRVSCPYGQKTADLEKPGDDPARCRVPGTSGKDPADVVEVPVPAQLIDRTAAASPWRGGSTVRETVYCSCRCANAEGGKDDGAHYCDCPNGYTCKPLVDDLGFGKRELAGSYCIRNTCMYSVCYEHEEPPKPGACGAGTCCDIVAANCGNDGKNP